MGESKKKPARDARGLCLVRYSNDYAGVIASVSPKI
jgi:hypothetical protein